MPSFSLERQREKIAAALGPTMALLPESDPAEEATGPQLILDPRDGKLWTNAEEYEKDITKFYNEQSRQIRSSQKYQIQEDHNELCALEGLSFGDLTRLMKSCERELETAATFSVDDEGLFVAREQCVPCYFDDFIGWVPPAVEEDVEDEGGMLRVAGELFDPASSTEDVSSLRKFTVSEASLMALDPGDRDVIGEMIKQVTLVLQRRVALERNRMKLHVLIEDALRSIDLYTSHINAVKIYDQMMKMRAVSDEEEAKAVMNYRQIILGACCRNLKHRRHEIFKMAKILDNSRVWIEDLLERAVKTEKQIQLTIDELLQGPFPILNVTPPDISQWMLEAEQVAHTCANISYLITTKLELNPKRLSPLGQDTPGSWILGIPEFEAFIIESDGDDDDDQQASP